MNAPPEALFVWDFTTNTIAWTTSGDPGIPFSHNASLRRRWLVVDWNSSAPHQYAMFTPDVANSGQYIGGPANANDFYGNGSWIQHPADLNDQWAVFSTMEGLQSSGGGWLAPGGIVLITPNGSGACWGIPTTQGRTTPSIALCGLRRTGATSCSPRTWTAPAATTCSSPNYHPIGTTISSWLSPGAAPFRGVAHRSTRARIAGTAPGARR